MGSEPRSTPLLAFVVLAYGISWGAWGAGYLLVDDQILLTGVVVIGGFGPMVAAAIVVRSTGESVRGWLQTVLAVRVAPRWYAIALGLPLLFPIGLTVGMAARGVPLDPTLPGRRVPLFFGAFVGAFFVGGGQEEFGWRGFLLPRLQRRFSALESSLVIGVLWAFWHLPLYVLPGAMYAERPFGPYVLIVVGLAILFTWLYNNTGGSIPVAMVMHASVNSSNVFIPVSREFLETAQNVFFYTASQAGIALFLGGIVVAIYGAETLTRNSAIEKYRRVLQQTGGTGKYGTTN